MARDVVAAHEAAIANLDALKATCTDACVDEAVHAPHRADLEAAYRAVYDTSHARVAAGL